MWNASLLLYILVLRVVLSAWVTPSKRLCPFFGPNQSPHPSRRLAADLSNAIVAYLEDKSAFTEATDDPFLQKVAQETWNWCANFVVPHNLCPWALASVQTRNALRLYIINDVNKFDSAIECVATEFNQELQNSLLADPNTAIAFCVLASKDQVWDFDTFYEWFVDMEEDWLDQAEDDSSHIGNYVTLAPFHPNWQFASDESDDPLQIEKQSPYPTVTIVSTAVIDKAGETATAQIADNNARVLQSKTLSHWKALYHQAVFSSS